MDPIDLLMDEHRLILSALDALDGYARRLRRNEPVERGELARFVSFIRDFADARHHGKEEDILFATMVEQGFPREAGPVAAVLAEHEETRAWLYAEETRWPDAPFWARRAVASLA